jgi:hypothetical protein
MRFVRHLAAALLVVAVLCAAALLLWGPATIGGAPPRNRHAFERPHDGTIIGPNGQPIPPAIQRKLAAVGNRDRSPSNGLRLDIGNLTNTSVIELAIAAVVVSGSATRRTALRRSRRRDAAGHTASTGPR